MFGRDIEIRARRADFSAYLDEINLFGVSGRETERVSMANSLEFVPHKIGEIANSFVRISGESAQKLIDDLWDCGLRPSEGTGSAGCLQATQKHLEDMKKIVFKKLNIT